MRFIQIRPLTPLADRLEQIGDPEFMATNECLNCSLPICDEDREWPCRYLRTDQNDYYRRLKEVDLRIEAYIRSGHDSAWIDGGYLAEFPMEQFKDA